MTDNDALLRVTRHVNRCRDAIDCRLLLIAINLNLTAIRNLLIVVGEYLLANNLRCKEAQSLVGQSILRIVGLALGQIIENLRENSLDIKLLLSRRRNDYRLRKTLVPLNNNLLKLFLRCKIYLVDNYDCWYTAQLNLFDNIGRTFTLLLDGIRNIEHHVSIANCSSHEVHHRLLQFICRLQDSRGIRIYNLKIITVDDTHNTMTCSLRLRSDNRKSFTHQSIHQCRFSDVRITDNIYKTALMHLFLFFMCVQR